MRLLLALPALLAVCLACSDDDDGPNSSAGGSGGSTNTAGTTGNAGTSNGSAGDGYRTVGCLASKDGKTSCTTSHGPLTDKQIADVSASCTTDGGQLYLDETCPRPEGGGCCISSAAGARVTTCISGTGVDPSMLKSNCEQSSGYWSTAIGDNPPTSGTGGSGGSTGVSTQFTNGCHQPASHQCMIYKVKNDQLDASCVSGMGTVVTVCPADGLLGCCVQGGFVATCYYPGGSLADAAAVEQSCKAGGNTYSATSP